MTMQVYFLGFRCLCAMTTYHDAYANFGSGWRWHSGPHRDDRRATWHFRMVCVGAAVRRAWLRLIGAWTKTEAIPAESQ